MADARHAKEANLAPHSAVASGVTGRHAIAFKEIFNGSARYPRSANDAKVGTLADARVKI